MYLLALPLSEFRLPRIHFDKQRGPCHDISSSHAMSHLWQSLMRNRWDSSDPERAPPPLPLNPQSPIVSRAGTSSAIQSAHAALAEKARENAALVPHVPKHQRLETSPERPLPIPGMAPAPLGANSHRRMNSLQPTSVKDMSMMIEAGSSPARELPVPRSPEKNTRPVTPSRNPRNSWIEPKEEKDYFGHSGDDRSQSVISPKPGPSLTPIIRPTARRATHQSILGENTPPPPPPSMEPEKPQPPPQPQPQPHVLADITNNSQALVQVAKVPESLECLSNQILTLTDIATTLQKEMSLLSRRSRDNATDLLSLKEATNARDEDIRKSLRDLITESKARSATRDPYGGPLLLEGRHHTTSPTQLSKSVRPFSLPRIPSPNSFAASIDRESILSTPSLVGSEAGTNSTTVTLVEKIIRDMATKEGQESLGHRLSDLADKLSGMATADKVEELARFIKENQQQAVVPAAGGAGGGDGGNRNRNWDVGDDDDDSHSHSSRLLQGGGGSEGVNEEVYKAIKTVKDSLANAGGLTAEVKALVVKLRGEVLHMGRDLGQKFEELLADGVPSSGSGGDNNNNKAEMQRIVEQGLAQMSEQMNKILREYRYTGGGSGDASTEAHALTGPREAHQFDSQELYNAMRAALKDTHPRTPDLRREDVMQAVKDAWEKYKPEIEIQQIGLERDEVLECLEQGLSDFKRPMGATREEVFGAVAEGLRNYQPPKVEVLRKQDVLEAVTECLSEWEFPAPPKTGEELTREDMLDAVREGILAMPPPPEPKPGVTREDVIDAVADALDAFDFSKTVSEALVTQPVTKGDVAEAVGQALKGLDLSDDMLDAVQEGLRGQEEKVRAAVEQGLKGFDIEALAAMIPRPDLSRVDVADAVKEGLEFLDLSRDDVADAVKDGLEKMDLTNTLSKSLAEAVKKVLEDHDFGSSSHSVNNERALVPRSASMGSHIPMPSPPSSSGSEMPMPTSAAGPSVSKSDIQEAVKNALGSLDFSLDVADAVKATLDGFDFAAAAGSNSAVAKSDLSKDDVVDAVKEGIQAVDLSTEIAADVIDLVKKELDSTKSQDPEAIVAAVKRGLQEVDLTTEIAADLIDAVRKEFQTLSSSSAVVAANATTPTVNNEESASEEVKKSSVDSDGLEKLRQEIESYVDHLLKTLDGFRDEVGELNLREVVNSSMVPVTPQGGMYTKEVLEAIQEGLSSLRAEEGLGDIRILDALKTGLDNNDDEEIKARAIVPVENAVKKDDIKHLETLLTQLGTKVEVMQATPVPDADAMSKEDVRRMEDTIRQVQESVAKLPSQVPLASMEDALEKIQATVSEIENDEPALREDQGSLAGLVSHTRESVGGVASQLEIVSQKEDVLKVESLVNQRITKTDVDAVEAVCLDTKENVEQLELQLHEQAEIVGVGERVGEVKAILEDFHGVLRGKLEEGAKGAIAKNDTVGDDLKVMLDALKTDVEDEVVIAKLDERRAAKVEERDANMEAAVVGNKAIAEELKQLVDTLGSAVTDSMERMEEASKTVFERVATLTVQEAITKVSSVNDQVAEYQPKILQTLEDFVAVVGQHYEQLHTKAQAIQERVDQPVEKYDDTAVNEKLDVLVGHTEVADKAFERLDTLDEVHSQVKATAAELAKTLQETIVALEQQERLKQYISSEEARLKETIASLKEEQELLKETFLSSLKEEQARIVEANVALKQARIMETNEEGRLKEEEDFIKSFQEEELRLREEENEALKASLKEEYEQAKAQLKEEHEQLKAQLKAEQEALKATFKTEQDELRAAMKEDNDRLKIELLSNLMEEETRVKDANAALRERIKTSLADLRLDQEDLNARKNNLRSELSTLEAACKFRREEVDDLTNQSEHMERKVLEGVMDLSRFSSTMSRKRVARGTAAAINAALVAQSGVVSPESQSVRTPAGGAAAARGIRKGSWTPMAATPKSRAASGNQVGKGYGDLMGDREVDVDVDVEGEEDKENVDFGVKEVEEVEEVEEEEVSIHHEEEEEEPEAVKVDEIRVDESEGEDEAEVDSESEDEGEEVEQKEEDVEVPAVAAGADSESEDDEEEEVVEAKEEEAEAEEPTLTQEKLRRASNGTTVVTPNVDDDNDEFTVDEEDSSSEESDFDDGASDWTNPPAAMGTETNITALEIEVGTPVEERKKEEGEGKTKV
ncbi:hypothetical protein B0T21DRAFT_444003 [Apiosordaria backusii]|uniref:Uncharacterized protein n=1 Tax=Apiosordaria backusii TaxID=314023 RepID=A0AA40EEV4_9PEZI|nr:hypothetical protein B0T21DRAFT_444003 [Apiosordaria backusii]